MDYYLQVSSAEQQEQQQHHKHQQSQRWSSQKSLHQFLVQQVQRSADMSKCQFFGQDLL